MHIMLYVFYYPLLDPDSIEVFLFDWRSAEWYILDIKKKEQFFTTLLLDRDSPESFFLLFLKQVTMFFGVVCYNENK